MKTLPLNALRAFAYVYAEGGVRAAGRELDVAHSSVSRHLTELEDWLGVRLTEDNAGRGRQVLVFTAQGEALGKAISAGLQDISSAVSAIREARSTNSVALASTPSFAARWLLPRLPILEVAHPRIELSIVVEQRLVDPVEGEVDLAIRMGHGPWPKLHSVALMDDRLYPVMSPSYWAKVGKPTEPSELKNLKLLHDRDPNASWEMWRNEFGPQELSLEHGPRYAATDLLLRAAIQGQGVALARHRLAEEDIEMGRLIRPFGNAALALKDAYWLVSPNKSQPKPAVKIVMHWLQQQARSCK